MSKAQVAARLMLMCGLLAGCSNLPLRRDKPRPPGTSVPRPPPPEPAATDPAIDTSATAALIAEAGLAEAQGDLERASAILERAIRVEPTDPLPWNRLAELRLHQERWQLAEQLAARSNQLAREDSSLRARNWRVIAASRGRAGDSDGALAAEREANRLADRARRE